MERPNEFLLVLNKMGFKTMGGGAVGGRISYGRPHDKDTVVSLRLHPMDGRVLDWDVSKEGQSVATGDDPKQLLRTLQDKGGAGKFRKLSFGSNRKLAFEDLDQYGNNIEKAISEIFKLDEQLVKEIVSKMRFEEYLNLAIALDNENIQLAEKILEKYGIKPRGIKTYTEPKPTPESVAQHINYLTKNYEDNIVTPEFKHLKISEQKKVLNTLLISQLQKMLANLRGYNEPGIYESGLFTSMLKDEIILKSGLQVIFQEAIPNAPNKPNNASSDTRLEKDAEVAVTNATGETEDGTVINDTGNMVTVQTKTGRKTVKKDEILQPVVDENAFDVKRFKELAGIKTQSIQKTEEIEEDELTEDDNSLGTSYTLEVDGEEVKKNDDAEDLMHHAEQHAGVEWIIYDSETGDIAASSDGDGFLQDAGRDTINRQGRAPGWERENELLRNPAQPEEPFEDDWWKEFLINDKDAGILAQRIMHKIGEIWPDGDPMDAIVMVMKKHAHLDPDSIGWDAAINKVQTTFEANEGVDFYGYFNQLTDQLQADNPGRHSSERFKKGGGGRAEGQFDNIPRL